MPLSNRVVFFKDTTSGSVDTTLATNFLIPWTAGSNRGSGAPIFPLSASVQFAARFVSVQRLGSLVKPPTHRSTDPPTHRPSVSPLTAAQPHRPPTHRPTDNECSLGSPEELTSRIVSQRGRIQNGDRKVFEVRPVEGQDARNPKGMHGGNEARVMRPNALDSLAPAWNTASHANSRRRRP